MLNCHLEAKINAQLPIRSQNKCLSTILDAKINAQLQPGSQNKCKTTISGKKYIEKKNTMGTVYVFFIPPLPFEMSPPTDTESTKSQFWDKKSHFIDTLSFLCENSQDKR